MKTIKMTICLIISLIIGLGLFNIDVNAGLPCEHEDFNNDNFCDDCYSTLEIINSNYILKNGEWKEVPEFKDFNLNGYQIYNIGDKTYFSNDKDQLVLNNDTWEKNKELSFKKIYNGSYVWSDGDNTYYSCSKNQYVFKNNRWEKMRWNGLKEFEADNIWSDGKNIYYSYSEKQYILNSNNNTWEPKVWGGLTNFNGNCVWSDGINRYLSQYSFETKAYKHYVLNNNTWVPKQWQGFTNFDGRDIWNDGENTYNIEYISELENFNHYVLNGDTWVPKQWQGFTNFDGRDIWSDGINIYFSITTIDGPYRMVPTGIEAFGLTLNKYFNTTFFGEFIDMYKNVILFVLQIISFVLGICFIFNIFKLTNSTKGKGRKKIIIRLIFLGVVIFIFSNLILLLSSSYGGMI